jgi:hypothetical protein
MNIKEEKGRDQAVDNKMTKLTLSLLVPNEYMRQPLGL